MVDYGIVRSTIRPEEKVVDEYSVWVNSDIVPVEENTDGEESFIGFEFHQVQYSKDEYISLMDERNMRLEQQLTDTQLALCEIYEGMV